MASPEDLAAAIQRKQQAPQGVTLQQLDAAIARKQQAQQPEVSFGERALGLGESVLSSVTGAIAQPISGIAGLAAAPQGFIEGREGAGAETQRQVQEALTFQPRTERGRANIEADILRPVGETIQEFQEDVGEGALELTGSPFLASIATALPQATLSLFPVKGLKGKVTPQQAAQAQGVREIQQPFSKLQTPTNQKISQLLVEGAGDVETAGVKLSTNKLLSKITDGLPRVAKDPTAIKVIDQGLDPATVAMVKVSNKVEKGKFARMLEIADKSLKNRKFRAENRVGDVAGESLLNRVRAVRQINKRSGQNLNKVANSTLKNQSVDGTQAVRNFADDLRAMDINISDDLKTLDFAGSTIEGGVPGASTAQNILKLTLNRLNNVGVADNALKLHKLKRFIDQQVTFGKTATGTAGASESALKNLRRNIDGLLDDQFPAYKKINDVFSETRGALDGFEKASGKSLNLLGESADKALGTKLRSLTNNTQTRANLIDSMAKIEEAAINNGVKFKDRILEQVLFADDLETLLKISPKTAFKGQIAEAAVEAASGSTIQAGIKTGRTVAQKLKGQSPDNAITAIRDLLKEGL